MAQVSISVADITIGLEDEDETAQKLKAIALKAVIELVEIFGVEKEKSDG